MIISVSNSACRGDPKLLDEGMLLFPLSAQAHHLLLLQVSADQGNFHGLRLDLSESSVPHSQDYHCPVSITTTAGRGL